MDFYEIVEERKSLRKYADKVVERVVIDKIVDIALSAPSSKNCQSTRFMVVTNGDLIRQISKMRHVGSLFLADAPVVILVMGDKTVTDLWIDNASISAIYAQLAIEAEGLGSCWAHVEGRLRDKNNPEIGTADDYLRTILSIPDEYGIECILGLGYSPYEDKGARTQKDNEGKVFWVE